MVVKKKVSLGETPDIDEGLAAVSGPAEEAATTPLVELFFDTGIILHEVALPRGLPDRVSSFVLMKPPAGPSSPAPGAAPPMVSVRRPSAGEDPDIELSAAEHLAEFTHRWLPVPYPLSCPFAVQVYLAHGPTGLRAVMAIDTLQVAGSQGRHLDASFDEGRPFRAQNATEMASFLDLPEVRELVRRLERGGIDRALFKLAALLEVLGPELPKLRFSRLETYQPVPVSLVLDFGNSRSTALLVEGRDASVFGVPLESRSLGNPLRTSAESFDSRIAFLPSPWDKAVGPSATGESFQWPSIARLGREALDRALETPHRYASTLSGPKRYLWDDRQTDERWHFAQKLGETPKGSAPGQEAIAGEYRPIFGRLLKYLPEESGGTFLRQDGPQIPADPRYAPRTMMLFAIVEILCQAYAQINSVAYRLFQGKEASPRVLRHLVVTFPSAMREEERQIYEALIRNAVILTCGLFNVRPDLRPNYDPETQGFHPFLFVDEALAAQSVFVFQETQGTFEGRTEEFLSVYGRSDGPGQPAKVRVASIDIGGGTSDVMIAEYEDRHPGTGTSLAITKLFQDGVSIAGDEVCHAIVRDVIIPQILAQLPDPKSKGRFLHLFGAGDAGHGSPWRTLRARLVPYLWLPLARCYWSVAEGFALPDHAPGRMYLLSYVFEIFGLPTLSDAVLREANRFLVQEVPGFPGIENLFFSFDARAVEQAALRVMREPMRRYADVLAQFDVDLLVLAGRTSALPCIRELFTQEMPVSPPRIKAMTNYRVGEWYPSKWKEQGHIKDAKSTVAAGAAVLHLARQNRLSGFVVDSIGPAPQAPIYGLYQPNEPHIARDNELFRAGDRSRSFVYTRGMNVGFRNVDSQEMEGSPLFEVRPATHDVETALLHDRVAIAFERTKAGRIQIASVESQGKQYGFEPSDFVLALKTVTSDKYWLDTGVFDVERVHEGDRRP